MNQMQKLQDPDSKLVMLGDGAGAFVKDTGLDVDTGTFGGVRCQRCSFYVKDGVVEFANLEGACSFVGSRDQAYGQVVPVSPTPPPPIPSSASSDQSARLFPGDPFANH